jgi:hypothetical protein
MVKYMQFGRSLKATEEFRKPTPTWRWDMKKAAGIAIALFVGWVVLKGLMSDPSGSAAKVNDAADTAGQAGNSASTFISSLSGGALLVLVIIGVAIYLSKRK